LIAALAMRRRREGLSPLSGQVLIYPALAPDQTAPSYGEHANAPMLRAEDCAHYRAIYAGGEIPRSDPEFAPLAATHFDQMPPTFVMTADIDPLRDDGRMFMERIAAAGGQAVWRNEPQLVHGFLRARHQSQRAAVAFQTICATIRRMAQDAAALAT
jgi:acetyl esterase